MERRCIDVHEATAGDGTWQNLTALRTSRRFPLSLLLRAADSLGWRKRFSAVNGVLRWHGPPGLCDALRIARQL